VLHRENRIQSVLKIQCELDHNFTNCGPEFSSGAGVKRGAISNPNRSVILKKFIVRPLSIVLSMPQSPARALL
jgi:hypothetical protein